MNPQSPREELEIRITALLMGELPPDEAAALQTQIAADAELTSLHARLARALGLLREATTAQEPHALQAPVHLSDERRARLLAHFQGAKPGPVIVKPRRDWKWAVPLGLAASLMALIGGAMYVNGFALRKASVAGASGMGNPRDEDWASQPGMIRVLGEKRKAGATDALHDGAFAGRNDKGVAVSESTTDRARFFREARSRSPELNLFGRPRVATAWPSESERTETVAGLGRANAAETPPPARTAGGGGAVYLPPAAAKAASADFDAGIGNFPAATDLFSMNVVEPHTISEPYSTGGKANVPQALAPFSGPLSPKGGAVSADSEKSAPGGGPAFAAGSFWDTPRVQTHFDRGTDNASFRGGLASSQPVRDEFQQYPADTGIRGPIKDAEDRRADIASGKPGAGEKGEVLYDFTPRLMSSASPGRGNSVEGAVVPGVQPSNDEMNAPRPPATPAPAMAYARAKEAGTDGKQSFRGFTGGGTSSSRVAKDAAESAPEKGEPDVRRSLALRGSSVGDASVPAAAEAAKRTASDDIIRYSSTVGSVSSTGGLTKSGGGTLSGASTFKGGGSGTGTLTLSGASTFTGGTTVSGGTLQTQTAGEAGAGAKPGAEASDPNAPAKPATGDQFASSKTEGESRAVPETTQKEALDVDLKGGTTFKIRIQPAEEPRSGEKRTATEESVDLAVKNLRDRVDKSASPNKPTTTSLGVASRELGLPSEDLYALPERARGKGDTTRGESSEKQAAGLSIEGVKGDTNRRAATYDFDFQAGTTFGSTKFALGDQPASNAIGLGTDRESGPVRIDYGTPTKDTAGHSPADGKFQFNVGYKFGGETSGDGRKTALDPQVAESDGFLSFGGAIAGKPAGAPAATQPAASGESGLRARWVEARRDGTLVNPAANATDGGRRSDDNPVADRIAFWTDDDTSKVNITGNGRTKDQATTAAVSNSEVARSAAEQRLKHLHYFADLDQRADRPPDAAGVATSSGVIAGTGGVTLNKAGAGAWKFEGANTFTGGTTVNAGTLSVTPPDQQHADGVNISGNTRTMDKVIRRDLASVPGDLFDAVKAETALNGGTLSAGGSGVRDGNLPSVTTKSGQRSNSEVIRKFNDPIESQTPEIPKNFGKAGDGPISVDDSTIVRDNPGVGDKAQRESAGVITGDIGFDVVSNYITKGIKVSNDPHNTAPAGGDVEAKIAKLKQQLGEAESHLTAGKSDENQSKLKRELADAQTESDMRKLPALDQKLDRQKSPEAPGERETEEVRAKSNRLNSDVASSMAPGSSFKPAPAKELKRTAEAVEQMEKKLAETSLVEAEKDAAKKVLEQIRDPEPTAPKPAPDPLVPQPEIQTKANAFSTFSLNVSDVAFKLAAASLERGTMPDVSTLRTEEFINAFDYRDPEPRAGTPLAFVAERARYPFAQNRDLVRLSVKTAAAGRQPGKPLNVVLLLDNSGSMERADRVRIVREAMRVLSAQLTPQDKLSIVTFSRTPRLWADGVAGDKAAEVTARVGEITPEGGTNLASALDLGYATALKHYQPGSINHVVVLTDGAANLGNVDPAALKQKVEAHRKQGIALDCFGVGWEGLNDDMLEQLSRNGDGRYGFINTPEEAATNFAAQLAGALRVAASDVKVQVEWNPKRVTAYRQVGYAKHQLTKEQFRDNTVDAAELAAAESGNALYVVEVNPRGEGDLGIVRVRFKVPGTSDYREHEWAVPFTGNAGPLEQSSTTLRLAATAAAFSEMLAVSPFATEVTSDRLLGLLNGVPAIYGADPRPKKLEWMIRQAKSLSGR